MMIRLKAGTSAIHNRKIKKARYAGLGVIFYLVPA